MKILNIILLIILCLCLVVLTFRQKVGAVVIKIYIVDEYHTEDANKRFIFDKMIAEREETGGQNGQ